jgi:F0F1-type ATP synthase gamma subunit
LNHEIKKNIFKKLSKQTKRKQQSKEYGLNFIGKRKRWRMKKKKMEVMKKLKGDENENNFQFEIIN